MNAFIALGLIVALVQPACAEFDKFDRLISYPGKTEVPCPVQDKDTGVILVIGQSNSGNHAEQRMASQYPNQVFNYFNGKCYQTSSPLLGTTGEKGEFMTPMADYLIQFGVYKRIIIVPSGINGTKIAYWKKGGYLNDMLMDVLDKVYSSYELTEIVWHQGESDFLEHTSAEEYKTSFYSLLSTVRHSENKIPFYYAIATRCSAPWSPDNVIAQMQRTLSSYDDNIYLGADTDSMVLTSERIDGFCHFKESGQFAMSICEQHISSTQGRKS